MAEVEESRNQFNALLGGNKCLSSKFMPMFKVFVSMILFILAIRKQYININDNKAATSYERHLTDTTFDESNIPTYMTNLMEDLKARNHLMETTPPEEVKYWFEYTGPLQRYYYRYSKSRKKADSFEGRDDSGVISSRFIENPGGGEEYASFFMTNKDSIPDSEKAVYYRILDNCLAMGSQPRPKLSKSGLLQSWLKDNILPEDMDLCRILIVINTVGAGHGTTILWETQPPIIHSSGPMPWISEQATALTHLRRNLEEINFLCATELITVRLQMLVCEPIPDKWADWIDSMLPQCGGELAPFEKKLKTGNTKSENEEHSLSESPSPIQIVVVADAATSDTCHDLKSGFMEKRMQDLILAPPYLLQENQENSLKGSKGDPTVKTTHPDLMSSADHDLYIAMKWSSLVTIRAVSAFLQASADIAAAALSPKNQGELELEKQSDAGTIVLDHSPSSPFLLPSFIRVSYVSEESNKVAKWRMHGDFFHPAAWEVCKDSFDMTWIPDSISGNGGIHGICFEGDSINFEETILKSNKGCGQWWIYMAEEQMPLNPEVYANEVTNPLVQGGSNYFWMISERHRKEIVRQKVCEQNIQDMQDVKKCGEIPQAVIPLGDLESFLINFTPNTALGKKHNLERRPGYSREKERQRDREIAVDRKQLKGQTDIEKALFDYTVYPVALFRKDATIAAARLRDNVLTKQKSVSIDSPGPHTVKSSYYDVTITKPRQPTPSWCQAISRKGLCTLYAEYFRESHDWRCTEACGMSKNWSLI